jgi:L-ascorbate metabolism protein UlaG (beta-lactamase superfamily)
MIEPFQYGTALVEEIETTFTRMPTLWWLGHAGFVIRFANITFYIDPVLATPPGATRAARSPLDPALVRHADLVLCTHSHSGHMDGPTLEAVLKASPHAKVVLPKSAAEAARALGVPYSRMTTTDSGLRVEYFKEGLYGRVYAVPSAHPELNWTAIGGYPFLGYLIRFDRWTLYHSGDTVLYEGLADKLRPYNVNVAMLPISGRSMSMYQAADLAQSIGAQWMIPMHYGTFARKGGDDIGAESRFVMHMLGHRPAQAFKVFKLGEKWTLPE